MSNFGDHPAGFFADPSFYNGVATQSLRFDDGSAHKLTRTFSADADNAKKMTISVWAKRGNVTTGATQAIIANYNSVRFIGELAWLGTDVLRFDPGGNGDGSSNSYNVQTTALFRDVGSWYHIVLAYDTTQGTDTNRVKLYVNGTQQTLSAPSGHSFPPQNYLHLYSYQGANNTIGEFGGGFDSGELDGYLSEFNFIDGLALAPTSFGETKNGVWIAKKYTGNYGTNGYRLQFDQVGVGTASTSTIGADTSGNNNHWTSSGTAAHDCAMPDSPENNFCTWNPISSNAIPTLTEGNLKNGGTNLKSCLGTFGVTSGKWYWEERWLTDAASSSRISFSGVTSLQMENAANVSPELESTTGRSIYRNNDNEHDFKNFNQTSRTQNSGGTYWGGAIASFALDMDAGTLKVYTNNSLVHTDSSIPTDGTVIFPLNAAGNSGAARYNSHIVNFGQDSSFAGNETAQGNKDGNGQGDFFYAVPAGHRALCSANLPEPTISPNSATQADDYFQTVTYTGTGSSNAINTVGFQTDWLWIKRRNGATSHRFIDSSRGVDRYLSSDTTNAEDDATGIFTSFDTNGFTVEGTANSTNGNNQTYVAWNWKANGGTTSSNSDGSITSTVQANTTAGFSIVTYSGNATSGATVGHGLGVAPQFIIIKNRDTAGNWTVRTTAVDGSSDLIQLNLTAAKADSARSAPTSTVFSIGSGDVENKSGDDLVAYCFHSVEGYSRFGSYTGNGDADGTFVFTGFRPAFVLIKQTSAAGNNWRLYDSTRQTFNVIGPELYASSNDAESDNDRVDFLSNGLKFRATHSSVNDGTHIYMAFAEAPFKYSNAR